MNTIDEVALIGLVRKYPLLYDLTSPLYNDPQKKEEAWGEISNQTSASAYECKTKWTRLRDNYRKALIVRNKNTGRAKDRAVKYEKQLSFLTEKFAFAPRKRNNMSLEQIMFDNHETEESANKVAAVENTPQTSESKAVEKPAQTKDELNVFFEGIAETVKTFPKKIQVQMKRDIFNLVNHTEVSLLDNENENGMYYMNSPASGLPGYNRITDSPGGTSGSNEYNASSMTNTDNTTEHYFDVEIKSEIID